MATSVPISQQTTLHSPDEDMIVAPHFTTASAQKASGHDIEAGILPVYSEPRTAGALGASTSKPRAPSMPRETEQSTPTCPTHPRKYVGSGTHEDPYLVDWDIADPENPYNWSRRRKWAITAQASHRRPQRASFTFRPICCSRLFWAARRMHML